MLLYGDYAFGSNDMMLLTTSHKHEINETDLLSSVAVLFGLGHSISQHFFKWLSILHPLNQSHSVT